MILQKLSIIGNNLDKTLNKLRDVQREQNRTQIAKGADIITPQPGLNVEAFLNAIQNDELAK